MASTSAKYKVVLGDRWQQLRMAVDEVKSEQSGESEEPPKQVSAVQV